MYSEILKALHGTMDTLKLFLRICPVSYWRNWSLSAIRMIVMWWTKLLMESSAQPYGVDNLMVSHADYDVVANIIKSLIKNHGVMIPVSINCSKILEYLGTAFNQQTLWGQDNHSQMHSYCHRGHIRDLQMFFQGNRSGNGHIYNVRDPNEEGVGFLSTKNREEFYTLTAQCLYLSKRGIPDLQISIAFHFTRVQKVHTNIRKKLSRTIRHLMSTVRLSLLLQVSKHGIIGWWVDTCFAVHEDMMSRTGMYMSLGPGKIHAGSMKQKINTPSSTHAELV